MIPAIWLRREGPYAVVLVKIDQKWREVCREYVDAPFSHIVEARPMSKRDQMHMVMDGAIAVMKSIKEGKTT